MQALAQALPGFAMSGAPPSPKPETKPPRKIKCQNRASQWRRNLEQRFGGMLASARSVAETAEIEAHYHAEIERGPDFARVRREAHTFAVPPVKSIDRNVLARIVFLFEAMERSLWKLDRQQARDKGRKIRRTVQPSVVAVLKALVRLTVKYSGRVFPSLEGLAFLAGVSRSTAVAAVRQLERWGFLTVTRRCKREMTVAGVRLVQDTSLYQVHLPQGLGAMAVKVFGIATKASARPVQRETSESKFDPASKTKTGSAKEEVRVAHAPTVPQANLELLPDTFETPRRKINWWEQIRTTR